MIKVRISQIFSHAAEDVVAAKKELDTGASFEDMVQKYSTCPSKSQQGDLGWMPEGNAESLLGSKVSEDQKGEILGPIHSPYGYHILKVSDLEIERIEGPVKLEMEMSFLNEIFPDAHSLLFKNFHIGLPIEGYPKGETLANICKVHNKSELEVLNFLNQAFSDKNVATLSVEALKEKLSSGATVSLLDIREGWERDIAKIEGSLLITRDNNEEILSSLPKDREIVLIDWKQDRSPNFQKWLAQRGFTQAKCLEGGIDAWAEKADTRLSRYDIDEDDGYRYEDILEEPEDHSH
ncbi:MAG: hypothetical protein G3M78_11840 [Candidatus Nitrohelix vancouverensis]|uniref:Peptidylprolyl isomerase n=1 Tax=Candidatus Nitrohelix vancouverensis TaxID=2705534 RepID=A0A7T0C3T3_9BACT|nr:MAG: hypothetical protein G3M78_11840 [Candidatus Nitrohelix vancouverensis]